MAGYDPFDQGHMHDWRLEEAVKEGVRWTLRKRGLEASSETGAELLQAIRALIREMEFAREDAEIGFLALSRIARELSALLGKPVDLVPRNGLKPVIRESILQEERVIYAS